jgi:hypothetical protein
MAMMSWNMGHFEAVAIPHLMGDAAVICEAPVQNQHGPLHGAITRLMAEGEGDTRPTVPERLRTSGSLLLTKSLRGTLY